MHYIFGKNIYNITQENDDGFALPLAFNFTLCIINYYQISTIEEAKKLG